MPETMLDVLAAARAALLPLGRPVLIRGDPEPKTRPAEVFILDRVSSTGLPEYGRAPSTKRVQVTAYALTVARVLTLTEQASAALHSAGLRFIQQFPAPDLDHTGEISEYRS